MDEGCSKAVREVFVNLYNKGLIYQGHRIINWCPHCATALSDAEVEYEGPSRASCGTSAIRWRTARVIWSWPPPVRRPCLGDTGVAVNPNDERYKHLIGKTVHPADHEPRDPDLRRRVRRHGVRHRLRQDHPAPRPERLREWASATTSSDHRVERGRAPSTQTAASTRAWTATSAARPSSRTWRSRGSSSRSRITAQCRHLLPLRHDRRADELGTSGSSRWSRSQSPRSTLSTTARSSSCPTASPRPTSTGWRTYTTGASPASCGGDTAFRRSTATTAAR